MLWLTVRELRARPWRGLLTGMAAVIGVGLISGTLVLVDTAQRVGDLDSDVEQLGQVVLMAGGVALLVGAYIINAAFTVNVAQRTRELALLRCLGADAGQLRRMVRLESFIIGDAASLAGLAFGVIVASALRALVNSRFFDGGLPGQGLVVTPRAVLISLASGLFVTMLSALVPARRASRTSPLAALGGQRITSGRSSAVLRSALGAVTAVAGLSAVPLVIVTRRGYLLFPGAAMTLIGLRLLGPRVAGPLVRVVGLPVARAGRFPGALARQNAMGNPGRTAATASALMIGLALVTLVTVLSASTKTVVVAEANRVADFQVHPPRSLEPEPMDAEVVAGLEVLPELSSVVTVMGMEGTVGGSEAFVTAVEPSEFARVWGLDVVDGSVAGLGAGDVGITDDIAAAHGWSLGSPVEVRLARDARTFTVGAIYVDNSYVGLTPEYMLLPSDYARLGGDLATLEVSMRIAEGVTSGAARRAIERAVAGRPELVVEDRAEVREQVVGMINRATSLYLALTGLAALIGLFGIVNTMALSIVDRIRELGLLRAIGMERRQIRSMVRSEAVVIAVVGAVPGLGLGTLFAWGAAKALEHSSAPTSFTVPVATLALVAVGAAVAGVAAGVLPARWASRIDVLRAIATE